MHAGLVAEEAHHRFASDRSRTTPPRRAAPHAIGAKGLR
jgi:hypothetical protein